MRTRKLSCSYASLHHFLFICTSAYITWKIILQAWMLQPFTKRENKDGCPLNFKCSSLLLPYRWLCTGTVHYVNFFLQKWFVTHFGPSQTYMMELFSQISQWLIFVKKLHRRSLTVLWSIVHQKWVYLIFNFDEVR